MKLKNIRKLTALAAAASILSCSAVFAEESTAEETTMDADKAEDLTDMIVKGNNDMAAELTALLFDENQDLFFSPYSIYSALSMLSHCAADFSDGQENPTRTDLLNALGIDKELSDETIAQLQENLIAILSENSLNDIDGGDSGIPENSFIISNALLVDKSLPVSALFPELEKLLSCYDASAEFRDLSTQETMDYINDWVNQKTKGLIPEILTDPLPKDSAAALMNAVYFYGAWDTVFNEEDTDKQTFHGTKKDCEVDMMHLHHDLFYTETDDYQILILPYGNDYSMNIFLPKDDSVRKGWDDSNNLKELFNFNINDTQMYNVALSMPKFETSWSKSLDDVLPAIGLSALFDDTYLNRLTEESTALSTVLHKAKISVTEEGAEAAAVTIALVKCTSIQYTAGNVAMDLNHPFLYTITNDTTGLITFAGALNQPQ